MPEITIELTELIELIEVVSLAPESNFRRNLGGGAKKLFRKAGWYALTGLDLHHQMNRNQQKDRTDWKSTILLQLW